MLPFAKYDDTKILQFKDYAKILEVQRPMTFVIKVCGFSSLSRSGAPKFVSAFSIALVAGCKQSRVPAVQQSNIVLGMKRANGGIKSGQGATCHSCKAEFIYFNFYHKAYFFWSQSEGAQSI